MKALCLTVIFVCSRLFLPAQTPKLGWALHFAGPSFDGGQALTTDAAGNVYATGYFSGTTDFDPGPAQFLLTSSSAEDIYITKLDPQGKLVWARAVGDFRYQAGYDIALDAVGNIYVTGIFFGTVDFDPGPGETKLVSAGNEDVFLLKLDNNGHFLWAKKTGGVTNDYCNAVTTDAAGNVYIAGYFDEAASFTEGGPVISSAGLSDVFVCKFSSGGSFMWVKTAGGAGTDAAYSMGLDAQGNIFIAGFFFGTSDFDPGPATYNLQASGFGDGFILKLNSAGNFTAADRLGGTEQVRCTSIHMDSKNGAVLVGGYFDGDADFDPSSGNYLLQAPKGEEDAFIAKYNTSLDLVWAKQFSGPSFQRMYGIDTDNDGNVYTTGYFDISADFDPGPATYILNATGIPDAFVSKLDAAGNFVWAVHASGEFFEGGNSIKVAITNDVYITGTFNETTDFDPGADVMNLVAAGKSEAFVMKLKQCYNLAPVYTIDQAACSSFTLNGKRYDSSGTYFQHVLNSMGCDSFIVKLNLVISRIERRQTISLCNGNGWFAGGGIQTKQGIYRDTFRTAAGCDSVIITQLDVLGNPRPDLGKSRNICSGEQLVLDPGKFKTYEWQNGSNAGTYTVTMPGTYRVKVTDQNNCSAIATVNIIKQVQAPNGFLPAAAVLCNNNTLQLDIPGYVAYLWENGSTSGERIIERPGTYMLSVTDINQCTGTATLVVTAASCLPDGIPNAFTPDNNGVNDVFEPRLNIRFSNYQLRIYNRKGQQVFETRIPSRGWDGKYLAADQPVGTYVYEITFTDAAGKRQLRKGSLLLLR